MLTAEMTDALRCPVCAGALSRTPTTLRCPNNHSYDLNKHGYVTLGTGRKLPEGDTPAMVAARTAFLATPAYLPSPPPSPTWLIMNLWHGSTACRRHNFMIIYRRPVISRTGSPERAGRSGPAGDRWWWTSARVRGTTWRRCSTARPARRGWRST
ncbi:putative RNA methyltransferase [Catellatospora coxensis]